MAKVKEVSSYSGSAWSAATPLGADATNIDMTSNPSDYDSSTEETSTEIINTDDVKIISSDTDLTAWGKFNRFRKRVSNAFGTLSGKTLATAYTTASADSKIYSASVLNSYMTNVIGYSGTTAPSAGTVASQLSSLSSNKQNRNWTYIGDKTGTAAINPSSYTWKEIMCQVANSSTMEYCRLVYLIPDMLHATSARYFYSGYYQESAFNGAVIIQAAGNNIHLLQHKEGGTDKTSASHTRYYYR